MLILFNVLNSSSSAKTPKALITSSGNKIPFTETRTRLGNLLDDLGEPTWTPTELTRLTRTVHAYLHAFTGRQYDKTREALQRGDRYRPMIRKKLAASKIPLAFEALPMAESAYRYNANSRAGARGLWQYMPASARDYGLHVSKKLDERTDPVRSTDAALKYLSFLNRKFGKISVLLSVAAYNAGEGRIAKVVRRSGIKTGTRGYSRVLPYLPKETRGYVPEFLAAALILKDPSHFGFPVSKRQKYQYVQIKSPLSIKKIAQLAKLPLAKFRQLNPELKKLGNTPTHNFIIRLTSKEAQQLQKNLTTASLWQSNIPPVLLTSMGKRIHIKDQKSSSKVVYKVQRGNHLGGIADLFSVPIKTLRAANNFLGNRIKIGQSLIIPIKNFIHKKIYQVKSGDSLGLIAQRLGIPIHHLRFVNGVTRSRRIQPGQKLVYYV